MIDFDDMVHNFLKRELYRKEMGRYYPSECGSCLRKSWYSYKNPKETDKDLIKIFQAGNMIHDFVVDVLESEKNPNVTLLGTEVPFKLDIDGFVVSGRIDNIIKLEMNDEIYLVEVKSSSGLKFIQKPGESHVMQLQLYMHNQKIHNGLILYIEKNTLKTKIFEVKYDKNIFGEAMHRFKSLHDALEKDKVPDPEARIEKDMRWQCNKCSYREECYEDTPKAVLP